MELNDDEAIREATLAGMGVSIMSRHTLGLEPQPARLICLDVEGFPLANHWCLAYPTGKQFSARRPAPSLTFRAPMRSASPGSVSGLA